MAHSETSKCKVDVLGFQIQGWSLKQNYYNVYATIEMLFQLLYYY